ncbi:hypothetical protein M3B90_05110 [Dermabacter sp. p3-SID358]|uniref:DUF6541 family protein n=1 Tax=Dermabacter sp. p3-SID358 TaxID=2916114 RepID=UPI0021A6417D|nr:DUF6541 family protein [Dermabacter sp. p3-SID358]MCT1866900.1 hypothetical protein [Dermabacter sp. p3-SID358]
MTWLPLLLPAVVACLWVTVPGLVLNLSVGSRPLTAFFLSPLTSIGIIAIAAIAAPFVRLAWGPLPVILLTVALSAVALSVRLARDRNSLRAGVRLPKVRKENVWYILTSAPSLAVITVLGSFALMLRHVKNFLGSPYAFSQKFDAIFHLNEVRWMIETQNGSSLDALSMTSAPWESQFYPSAWHGLTSLTGLTSGVHDVGLLTNSSIIATLCVIWPVSMIALIYVLMPGSILRSSLFPAGVILAGVPAFPFTFVDYGVLYPNLLGYCLLPAMYIPFFAFIGQARRLNLRVVPTLTIGAVGALGTALAHPTAALMVLAGSTVTTMYLTARYAARRKGWRLIAIHAGGSVVLFGATIIAWVKIRPPGKAPETWGPVTDTLGAIGQVIINSPVNGIPQWHILVLLILAIVGALHTRFYLPLTLWSLCAFLWVAAASWDFGSARRFLVGVWYSDANRLYAQMGLFLIPAGALGVGYACKWIYRKIRQLGQFRGGLPLVAALGAVALIATTQATPAMDSHIDNIERSYKLAARTNSVNQQELTFMHELPEYVGPHDKIFANPWRGEGLIYAFTGLNVSTHHLLEHESRTEDYLFKHLDEIDEDPVVCAAINGQDYDYVVHFAGPAIDNDYFTTPGFNHLEKTKKLKLVHQRGNAYLYRITGCDE